MLKKSAAKYIVPAHYHNSQEEHRNTVPGVKQKKTVRLDLRYFYSCSSKSIQTLFFTEVTADFGFTFIGRLVFASFTRNRYLRRTETRAILICNSENRVPRQSRLARNVYSGLCAISSSVNRSGLNASGWG